MVNITDYIILVGAIFGFSVLCSFTRHGFSMGVFLVGISISISVLISKGSLPFFTIIFPILILVGLLFSDKLGMNTEGENSGSVDE